MRKTKRFSPAVLDRFLRENRGTGTGPSYLPWHRVSRSDPSSRGRSHLLPYSGRHLNLLSDKERIKVAWALMCPGLEDLTDQRPLALSSCEHELSLYDVRFAGDYRPGTLDLCRTHGFKHPVVNGDGRQAAWVMSTDLVLTLRDANGLRMLAVSVKPGEEELTERQRCLLDIERRYWQARGVQWLLLTPAEEDPLAARCLERVWPYMVLQPRTELRLEDLEGLKKFCVGRPLTDSLAWIAQRLDDPAMAQAAFWQSVLRHQLPVDLRRSWRPSEAVRLLSPTAFSSLNPILSGRTAWN